MACADVEKMITQWELIPENMLFRIHHKDAKPTDTFLDCRIWSRCVYKEKSCIHYFRSSLLVRQIICILLATASE